MKARKLLTTIAALAVCAPIYAQSTSTNSSTSKISDVLAKLQESPWSLTYINNTETIVAEEGATGDFSRNAGLDMLNIAYVGYKLSDKDSLRMELRHTMTNNKRDFTKTDLEAEPDHRFARAVVKYKRSILSEADAGINLSGGLEYRTYPSQQEIVGRGDYGLTRLSASASKTITDDFGLSATLYFARMNRKEKVQQNAKTYWYLVTGQSFQITPKLSAGTVQEFFHTNASGTAPDAQAYYEFIQNYELNYAVNDMVTVGVYAAHKPFVSNDGHTTADNWMKKTSFGAAFTASLF